MYVIINDNIIICRTAKKEFWRPRKRPNNKKYGREILMNLLDFEKRKEKKRKEYLFYNNVRFFI